MRICDDIGDDTTIPTAARAEALGQWRSAVTDALDGSPPRHIALPAICDLVKRFEIPHEYLFAAIDGVGRDLGRVEFETFEQLSDYCYHVAGVVGLCCIQIWGYREDRARGAAIDCGLALQLTNILRYIKEDARMDRVYLPREDLQRFAYSLDDIRAECRDDRFLGLMQFQVARARDYYARGHRLFEYLNPVGHPILDAMLRIYGGLLDEIQQRNYDVFSSRTRLSSPRKFVIAGSAVLRYQWRRITKR
jgi:phytoene synthase